MRLTTYTQLFWRRRFRRFFLHRSFVFSQIEKPCFFCSFSFFRAFCHSSFLCRFPRKIVCANAKKYEPFKAHTIFVMFMFNALDCRLVAKFLNFTCFFVKVYERTYGAVFFAIAVFEKEVSVGLCEQCEKCFFL